MDVVLNWKAEKTIKNGKNNKKKKNLHGGNRKKLPIMRIFSFFVKG